MRRRSPKERVAMMSALKRRTGGKLAPRKRRFALGAKPVVDEAFLKQHQGLVRSLAHRYKRRHLHSAADVEDLIQEGNIGLLAAAKRYNPKKGAFATIAVPHILTRIQRAAEAGYTIRTPEKALRKQLKAGKAPLLTIGGHTSAELETRDTR